MADSRKGFVISDLHIFSKRSEIAKHFAKIEAGAKSSEFLVLNGDIFDFEWSTLESVKHTVDAAYNWLKQLAEKNPQCQIYFVLGNHDSHRLFVDKLSELNLPNFQWSATHFVVGDSLFLHGDLPLSGRGINKGREYEGFSNSKPPVMSLVYDIVLRTRVQKLADILYNKYTTAAKIHKAFTESDLLEKEQVKHVYFGHTHVPFNRFLYKGIFFHNTGSGVKNFKHNFISIGND